MQSKEVVKTATKLINLTGQILSLYDKGTGDIVSISPIVQDLPPEPSETKATVFYIVNKKTANRVRHSGRSLKDVAILHPYKFYGSNNTIINYLLWGENHQTEVIYVPIHHH